MAKANEPEGVEVANRFDALVCKVLSVPHDEILRREAEYKRQAALNPRKRGAKAETRTSDRAVDAR